MGLKITSSMLTGISNRMFFLLELEKYYKTSQWKKRRNQYLSSVGGLSEVSGQKANVVHHITYQFKSVADFKNKELFGSEKNGQLLALTTKEHAVTHLELQHVAHKPRKLLNELKSYLGY